MANVIDTETGKQFRLMPSEQFDNDIRAHEKSFLCSHDRIEPRRTVDGGGAQHFHRQCLQSGKKIGSAIGQAKVSLDMCGKFDVSAVDAMAEDGPCGPKQRELEPLK